MFVLILSFLYFVSAQSPSAMPIYSRAYLLGLRQLENERVQAHLINRGIWYVENAVFHAAKQGLVKVTEYNYQGCEAWSRPSEIAPYGLDKEVCENIIDGIKKLVSERFPDSEVIYDTKTKQHTLKWD